MTTREVLHSLIVLSAAAGLLIVGAVHLASAAGGSGPIAFENVAAASGVVAEMQCGSPEKRWITEANGTGAAWLDYDNDGRMDLLLVNGSSMEQLRRVVAGGAPAQQPHGVYLFHNLGGGRFEDVTEKAGLRNNYWGTGANAADYNNDGYTDILITTLGRDLLYKNNGNGTFSEVGKSAGLSQSVAWHTGSAFGDFDGDGFLDLFVASYIDLGALSLAEPAPVCDYRAMKVFCGPIGLKGGHSVLYHNNRDGTFAEVTKRAGLDRLAPAHGFTAVADDFDGDGKIDLFVANDSDPNWLLINQGDGTFKEQALEHGVGFNADGRVQSNMGVAVGDYNGAGRLSILTTTFSQDYFPLFRQDKTGAFEEISAAANLVKVTGSYLGWASGFADFDNDGERELWTANGHVYPQAEDYRQPVVIFANTAGKFTPDFQYPAKPDNSYRGGAAGDFDDDGKLDLVILPVDGKPVLLHNTTSSPGSWFGLVLRGTTGNRDAIGARVLAEACGKTQFETVRNGGSYLSRNDPRLHFGLGSCKKVDRVTITWPRGARQVVAEPPLGRYTQIEEEHR